MPDLRGILDEGCDQLDVAEDVNDVDPLPCRARTEGHRDRGAQDRQRAQDDDRFGDQTHSLCVFYCQAPDLWVELRVGQQDQDEGMNSKGKVVEPHGGLWRERVPSCILSADGIRVAEACRGGGVGYKAQHIERRKIDGEADG